MPNGFLGANQAKNHAKPPNGTSRSYKNTNYLLVVQKKEAWVLFQALTLQQWRNDLRKKMKMMKFLQKPLISFQSSLLMEKKWKKERKRAYGFS